VDSRAPVPPAKSRSDCSRRCLVDRRGRSRRGRSRAAPAEGHERGLRNLWSAGPSKRPTADDPLSAGLSLSQRTRADPPNTPVTSSFGNDFPEVSNYDPDAGLSLPAHGFAIPISGFSLPHSAARRLRPREGPTVNVLRTRPKSISEAGRRWRPKTQAIQRATRNRSGTNFTHWGEARARLRCWLMCQPCAVDSPDVLGNRRKCGELRGTWTAHKPGPSCCQFVP
jgi:hypothetical protein